MLDLLSRDKEFNKIEIISRKNVQENINREDIKLQENNIFIELSNLDIEKIRMILQDTLANIRYNTFCQLDELYDEKEKNPNYNLWEIYEKMDYSRIREDRWTFCTWLTKIIKNKLNKIWIYSYFIRFDAWWNLNDEYLINWHTALCIPRLIWWEKAFTLIDPWMLISEPITFLDKKWTNKEKIWWLEIWIKLKEKDDLPYMMELDGKELFFDPYKKWLNTDETLWKDFLSATWKFKIVKQDRYWKPLCYFRFDIKNEIMTFKILLKEGNKLRLDFTFSEFLDLNNNEELLEIFNNLAIALWETDTVFFKERINDAIKIVPDFKKYIWVDSTRKKVYSLNKKDYAKN